MSTGIPRFLSAKLHFLRRLRGYTQEELAKRVGINVSTLRNYEKGKQEPSPQFVEWIARALEIPPVTFYSANDLHAFMESREPIEGMDDVNGITETPDQDVSASQSSSSPVPELDAEALQLFDKLPGRYSGISYTFTLLNESDWDAVEANEAEALSNQGVEAGSSVRAYLPVRTRCGDLGRIRLYATNDIAAALIAIEAAAAVDVVAKTVYATVVDRHSSYLTSGDMLYEDVSGLLIEEMLTIHPSTSKQGEKNSPETAPE